MLYNIIKPVLFRLDAERAHDLATSILTASARVPGMHAMLRKWLTYDDPILKVNLAGMHFANPIGLAAGFDKRGALVAPLSTLGWSHIEVGTVTPRPQWGNPRPRLFRLPEDAALINRMGFNSPGMLVVARNLAAVKRGRNTAIVGVNIGKNRTTSLERAVDDYVAAFLALAPLADYVTLNISSPNTPGLRQLHERSALETLLAALTSLNRRLPQPRPLFLKISPDETEAQLAHVAEAAHAHTITGLIAVNTTLVRTGVRNRLRSEAGGLSGQPLNARARQVIAYLYRSFGSQMPLIGVGGIASAADAYGHIRAGATLLQLYTAMIYAGPGLANAINRDVARLLRRDGFRSLSEAVGVDAG